MSRPSDCNHIDWPCCGCGHEPSQEDQAEMYEEMEEDFDPFDEREDNFRDDVEADADVLRMAGMGTEEDYGGACDLDQMFEDRFDCGE